MLIPLTSIECLTNHDVINTSSEDESSEDESSEDESAFLDRGLLAMAFLVWMSKSNTINVSNQIKPFVISSQT